MGESFGNKSYERAREIGKMAILMSFLFLLSRDSSKQTNNSSAAPGVNKSNSTIPIQSWGKPTTDLAPTYERTNRHRHMQTFAVAPSEQTLNSDEHENSPELDGPIPTDQELLELYNSNKEANDKDFKTGFSFEDTSRNILVFFDYRGVGAVEIQVKHTNNSEGTHTPKEVFHSISELNQKFPDYSRKIEEMYQNNYREYITTRAYAMLVEILEKHARNNFNNFVPDESAMAIISSAVELKNSGGNTDGYDEIYHHYFDQYMKGNNDTQGLYKFYRKYNCSPENLARYLTETYYKPKITK